MENSKRKNFFAALFHSFLVFLGEFVIFFEERVAGTGKVYMYVALIVGLFIGGFSLVYTLWTEDNNATEALHQQATTTTATTSSNGAAEKQTLEQSAAVHKKTALDIKNYYFFEEEINLEESSNLLIRPEPSLSPLYDNERLKQNFVKKEIFNTEDLTIEQEITKLAK